MVNRLFFKNNLLDNDHIAGVYFTFPSPSMEIMKIGMSESINSRLRYHKCRDPNLTLIGFISTDGLNDSEIKEYYEKPIKTILKEFKLSKYQRERFNVDDIDVVNHLVVGLKDMYDGLINNKEIKFDSINYKSQVTSLYENLKSYISRGSHDFHPIKNKIDLKSKVDEFESELIKLALVENDGVVAHAATNLTTKRPSLVEKMRRLNIHADDYRNKAGL